MLSTTPARPDAPAPAADRSRARRRDALGLGLWAVALTAWIVVLGLPTSRALVLLFAVTGVLATRLSDLRAGARSLATDVLPVFTGLFAYDLLRGRADDLTGIAHVDPQLAFDRALGFGTTPTERLQHWLYRPGPPAWYDVAAWALHLSHFFVSTALLMVLWRIGSPRFRPLLLGLLVLSYAALATYWVYPAVPPWLAADQGHIGPVSRVVHDVWTHIGLNRAPSVLSPQPTGPEGPSALSDPVAALPSLHAAIPVLLALTLRGVRRWVDVLLVVYAVAMGLALVYGGEHYVFDVLMGWGYAFGAWQVVRRDVPGRVWRRLVRRAPRTPAQRAPSA